MSKKPTKKKKATRKPRLTPDDPGHGCPDTGVYPNWRPAPQPWKYPHNHLPLKKGLETLKNAGGNFRGGAAPERSVESQADQGKFNKFVRLVVEKLEEYNEALDNWRKAEKPKQCRDALWEYEKVVKEFERLVKYSDLVDTSPEGEFVLETVCNCGFVTDVRVMAHENICPKDPEVLYSHSYYYVAVIPPNA